MESSFYYFFSATPQVLAGILALFGVFVIFKIQEIRIKLERIGQKVHDEAKTKPKHKWEDKVTNALVDDGPLDSLNKAINRHDIEEISELLGRVIGVEFDEDKQNYHKEYEDLQLIRKKSLYWSVFTSVIIVICLVILSLGECLQNHISILPFLFWSVIVLTILSLAGLVDILRKSLKV